MDSTSDSDSEVVGNEYEELCKNCDTLCKKLANPTLPVPPNTRFKKDTRVWLHKNPGFRLGKDLEVKEDSSSECIYSVMDMFGRKFKKDSRTWLHKSSRKRQRSTVANDDRQDNLPDSKFVRSGDLILPNVPTRPPGPFVKGEVESPLKSAFRNDPNKQFNVSNIIRKRKRRKQFSYSANNSPNDLRYNEEICRILADELNGNRVRETVSEEMFEIFEDDESCDFPVVGLRRQTSDHTPLSAEWRETRAITSDTSTQSSTDNQQMSVNQSPLSSGASINMSPESPNMKRSPSIVSTARKNYINSVCHKAYQIGSDEDCEMTPPSSPWSVINSQTNFSTNSCFVSAFKPLQIDSRRLNMNSRSVCFLIAESDEFLAEDNLLLYEEESDDENDQK